MKYNGPIINNTNSRITTRDNLGIEGVTTSISGKICPIVNTVTPRPYFWAFLAWCFYDYYRHSDPDNWSRDNVTRHAKRINFFIALGTILANKKVDGGFPGSDTILSFNILKDEQFGYKDNYLKSISTITYYFAGLDTMELVVNQDRNTGQQYNYPRIRPEGEKLAAAFDDIISKTQYYKNFRWNPNCIIPRNVLIELGESINIDLTGFEDCKTILIRNLFDRNRSKNLTSCKNYINYIKEREGVSINQTARCRNALYDFYSVRGDNRELVTELREVADNWEIVVGRQYFTIGLEMIWQLMIQSLNVPMTKKKWIDYCLTQQQFSYDLKQRLSEIIEEQYYSFEERENIIKTERHNSSEKCIENGLRIILSVYNRLNKRPDFSNSSIDYYYSGMTRNSISLSEYFELVDKYLDQPLETFIRKIMSDYLIKQHLETALGKMLQGRDGFFIEMINNQFYRKMNFEFDFQGIRMIQLYSVMNDLGVLF